ncbi:hypothetical protein ONZ45_g13247 [Pleurotus djamor]|nr:hypothetical protein ONZ45_g13247 [Pleurotus djamor]
MADTKVESTPVKPHKAPATCRREMEPPAQGLEPNANFRDTRLNKPTRTGKKKLAALAENVQILSAISAFISSPETSPYDLCVNALNAVLHEVHEAFPGSEEEELVCVDVHERTLRHHPHLRFTSRSDFAILPKSIADKLALENLAPAYHHIVSPGELKRNDNKDDGPKQCMTYLGLAGQALPHRVSLLGFSVWPGGYTLHWSSPSGVDCSEDFGWVNLMPLLEFAYTLHNPKKADRHLFYDDTITLSEGLLLRDPPEWDIKTEDTTYYNCKVVLVGEPWHRMTWIAKSPKSFIIKDQYRSDYCTFSEGELYETLHQAGHAPGFAATISYNQVKTRRKTIQVQVGGVSRTKTRMVLATTGDLVAKCENLIKFLKVMYDVLEGTPPTQLPDFIFLIFFYFPAHRHAVRRNVLHRDLSLANIMINAVHADGYPKKAPYDKIDRPRFINEVLSGNRDAGSEGLIIDLDNASKCNRGRKGKHNPLHARTGTPKYIARSVAVGEILHCNMAFQRMPELPQDAAHLYETAHAPAKDPLRTFKDDGTTHGRTFAMQRFQLYDDDPSALKNDFQHQPRHDAESVFWCILSFLLRALPTTAEGPSDDANNAKFNAIWKCFLDHCIPDESESDTRGGLLLSRQDWKKVLHPDISFVADLLDDLVKQVRPEYALLEPEPEQFNLHEAMQRLLLKYIVLWKDQDVKFHTTMSRNVITDSSKKPKPNIMLDGQLPSISLPTGTKRNAESANLDEGAEAPHAIDLDTDPVIIGNPKPSKKVKRARKLRK